ncbi:hypothetical protein LTR17_027426 [Elasticomyces elasticus]|nr:hypothetical protein LTR17_027426 [Elasticomyces elasticus]
MSSKHPSRGDLVAPVHDDQATTAYRLTLRRVWDDEEPSHVNVEGSEKLSKVLHGLSDLCKFEDILFTKKSEVRPSHHCGIRIEPIDCPVIFAAKPFHDGRSVADQECIHIGVAEVTARENDLKVVSFERIVRRRFLLSLHKSSMLWHLMLDPRDPPTAAIDPRSRIGMLKDRILFTSAQVMDGDARTSLIKETCEQGIVFGQVKQDMQIEWEYELEEDTFQEMLHRLLQEPMTWLLRKTTPEEALDILKSSQGDLLELNTKTVRQFYSRRWAHGFDYKLLRPAPKDEFMDALDRLGPFSRACDIAKLSALAIDHWSITNLNGTTRTVDADGTRTLDPLRAGFFFSNAYYHDTPLVTERGTPITYLPSPFARITAEFGDIDDQSFVIFPFATIARNSVGTEHIVAKDINSETYLAILEGHAGGDYLSQSEEGDGQEHDAVLSDEYVEEYDEGRGGKDGKDYGPKDRSDHHHKYSMSRYDDDDRENDCWDNWYCPRCEFSAYPAARWASVVILSGKPGQENWLNPTEKSCEELRWARPVRPSPNFKEAM